MDCFNLTNDNFLGFFSLEEKFNFTVDNSISLFFFFRVIRWDPRRLIWVHLPASLIRDSFDRERPVLRQLVCRLGNRRRLRRV